MWWHVSVVHSFLRQNNFSLYEYISPVSSFIGDGYLGSFPFLFYQKIFLNFILPLLSILCNIENIQKTVSQDPKVMPKEKII